MSKIPDDVMKAARDLWLSCPSDPGEVTVARAIMAERRRSADLGYATCAETRHVSLGEKVRAAILGHPDRDDSLRQHLPSLTKTGRWVKAQSDN